MNPYHAKFFHFIAKLWRVNYLYTRFMAIKSERFEKVTSKEYFIIVTVDIVTNKFHRRQQFTCCSIAELFSELKIMYWSKPYNVFGALKCVCNMLSNNSWRNYRAMFYFIFVLRSNKTVKFKCTIKSLFVLFLLIFKYFLYKIFSFCYLFGVWVELVSILPGLIYCC